MDRNIWTWKIIDNKTIAAGESFPSDAVRVARFKATGVLSLQVEVTGGGIVSFSYLLSNNWTDFVKPVGAEDIISSFSSTSGTDSNGKDMQPINIGMLPAFIKIEATEISGVDSATVNAWLALQSE
ncbi:MAG: hypothetical protein J7K85_07945 [Anaerolineaceae bacterium]|nr:hypothetical protein [Anaerolineaceae bacterium]